MAGLDMTLIHLSDLHIQLQGKETPRAEEVIAEIAAHHQGTRVVITGDLTDSATLHQFRQTRKLLNKLAKTNPILAVPGNHDYAWKGIAVRPSGWKNWVKYLGSPLGWGRSTYPWLEVGHEPKGIDGLGVWLDENCVFFGLDSGDPEDKVISARGWISAKLASALKQALIQYRHKTRIVLLHHHPFTHGFFTKLKGSQRLLDAVEGNCELLLFGHHHEYGIWWNGSLIDVPLVVASHKTTERVSGNCLMYTVLDIHDAGTPQVAIYHRLEMVSIK
jgi:3',5'-cyclic AMP phosphodiesterase CpdA